MARIQLTMPDAYGFKTDISVRITDINYGQHVGHDSIMSILHEARVQMLAEKGFSEMDVGGCGLIMADTAIIFLSEVFYPSTLRVEVNVSEATRSGFAVYYRVSHSETDAPVANAKMSMVCFDYTQKRVARMPTVFREAFRLLP